MSQEFFDGVAEHFKWIENGTWYEWNPEAARKTALENRLKRKKELIKQGYTVMVGNLGPQSRRKGGIGTNHPDIEFMTVGFYLNYHK